MGGYGERETFASSQQQPVRRVLDPTNGQTSRASIDPRSRPVHGQRFYRERASIDPRSRRVCPPSREGSSRAPTDCWEEAARLVGRVSREEAEADLSDRLGPIRLRSSPATAAVPTEADQTDVASLQRTEKIKNGELLDFLLQADEEKKPPAEDRQAHTSSKSSTILETNGKENDRTVTNSKPTAKQEGKNRDKERATIINCDRTSFDFELNDDTTDHRHKKPFSFDECDSDCSDSSEESHYRRSGGETYDLTDGRENNVFKGDRMRATPDEGKDFIKGLTNLLECGRDCCAEVAGQPVVLLIGPTGAGKSLLINAIAGKRFKRRKSQRHGKWTYEVDGEELRDFPIGQSFASETRHVRAYLRCDTGTYYVDSSGFGDNQCEYADLATSLSVQELARKCGRLRIAVLVNAYTFRNDRGTHLRNLLDLVKKFVGNNFDEFKTAFTFIFTHCRDALGTHRGSGRARGEADGPVIGLLREKLIKMLRSVRESEIDKGTRDLIDFMRSSLKNSYPFCEVFEPNLSNVGHICHRLEPSRNYLVNAASTVRCALTASSKLRLHNELKGRTQAVERALSKNGFDDELNENVNVVVTLTCFIDDDDGVCAGALSAMLHQLKQAKKALDEKVLDVIQRGVKSSDPAVTFGLTDVQNAKNYFGGVKQLTHLIEMCEKRGLPVMKGQSGKPESQPEDSQDTKGDAWMTILQMLREQGEHVRDEFANVKSYLALRESPLNDIGGTTSKPDCSSVRVVLQKLRAWAEVFDAEISPVESGAVKAVIMGLVEAPKALKVLESESNAVQQAYGCVRITAFLKAADRSGLLDCMFGQTGVGKSKRAHFDRTADEACGLAKRALSNIRSYMTTSQAMAFSKPVDFESLSKGGSMAARENGQLLRVADDLSALISSADLSKDLEWTISRSMLLEETMVTFRQRLIMCNRLVAQLNPVTVSRLEPCLCCLRAIACNIPAPLLTDGMFNDDLENFVAHFTKVLASVVSSAGRNMIQATKNGIVGDVKRQLTCFCTLRAGIWFDRWLKDVPSPKTTHPQLQTGTFFHKAYKKASTGYHVQYDRLSSGLRDEFNKMLSDKSSSEVVEQSARLIGASWEKLLLCREFVFVDGIYPDTVVDMLSVLREWCRAQEAALKFTDGVTRLPFDKVDRVLHVAATLKDADFKESQLHRLATSVASRLKGYYPSIMEVVQDGRRHHAKEEILDASRSWSQFSMLRHLLPDYAELRSAALGSFEQNAQEWRKYVESTAHAADIDVEEVTKVVSSFRTPTGLDTHFGGSMKSWADRIANALEIRLADLDEKLKGLVANNDYDGVSRYLSELKRGPSSRGKSAAYQESISVLANHWSGMFSMLRAMLGDLRVEIIPDMKRLLETLEGAETKLGDLVGQVPDWNGTLSDKMTRFCEEISTDMSAALDRAGDASKDMEYGDAYSFLARAKLLKSLARQGEGESKFRDVQEAVEKLLPDIADTVDRFLMSVSEINGDATSQTSSPHPVEPELPDTTALLEALRKLKLAAEREDCADIVKDSYAQESKKLTEGISSLYGSLRQDIADLKLSRPTRLLAYLRDQMEVKGMKEHLAMEFDVTLAMVEFDEAESRHQELMSSDMLEAAYVDEVARRLDALRTRADWIYWYKQDYEKLCIEVTGFTNEMVSKMERMIQGNQFIGIRSRFGAITYVCAKLGHHFTLDNDLQRLVSDELSPRLSQLETDLKRHLADDAIHVFDQSFNRTLLLFEEIPREHTSGETKKISSILDAYDSLCRQLRTSLHKMTASRVEALISEFQVRVDRWEFDTAATMVSTLQAVGQFLASSFEAYRCNHCHEADDEHLERLNRLNREHFSNDDFLEFGRHLSAFHLPTTASFSDVKQSYKILRERWEASKNPSDNHAQLRFRVINDAWAYLSRNVAQFKAFEGYEFTVVVTTISGIGQKVKSDTESLIESGEFETLRERYRRLHRLDDLVREVRDPRIVDAEAVRNDLIHHVRSKVSDLQFAVDRAWSERDSSSVHHDMTLIEAIEEVFGGDLGRTSVISDILLKQRKYLNELKDTVTRVDTSMDERTAFSRMAEFGADLIAIGRVMDCFARLKQDGEDIIRRLLDEILAASWGVAFIFQLGVKLDSGEIVRDDAGIRIGGLIVSSLSHFKDVRTAMFNTEVVSAPVDESIAASESFRYTRDLELDGEPFETEALTDAFERYKTLYDKFFYDNVSNGTDKLVEEVCTVARKFGRGGVRNWQENKRHLVIEVLAGVFATFTILKSGDIFNKFDVEGGVTDPKGVLFSPHNVQVLAVLRLLGIASKDARIENHIMEVRTGEGKSVILGALATVLALVGFQVRCVCYSEHLSERDHELFEEIFVAFGVESRITYSKINTMSEASVAAIGDIRQLTTDLIKGSTRSATEEKRRGRGRSDRGKEKRRGPTWLGRREGPNELNGEDVLLVDEVDVFFGADFYGETYKMVAQVDDPTVERLIRKIWDRRRDKPTASVVKRWPEYERVVEQFPGWRSLIEKEVRCMCSDVGKFDSPSYEVDEVNCRIGYAVMDSVDWEATYGYRTAFAFLNEQEQGSFSSRADLGSELSLRVSCGQFSYANVKPTLILGVSGTVRDLCKKERSIVKEMGVNLLSLLPSVYGQNNFVFDVFDRGIVIEEEVSRYHQSIADQIKKATEIKKETDNGGAALVFFFFFYRLLDFRRSSHWRNIRNGLVLDSRTKKENRDYIIRKAATSRQVTIATAPFGRGTDFFMKDRKLEESGGMVVVQTFLSCEKSEETQIKGRTARQGKSGSYVMVLLESDLCDKFGIEKGEVARKGKEELYSFLDEKRRAVHETNLEGLTGKVKEAEKLDVDSRRYLGALVEGNGEQARVQLMKMYKTLKKGSLQFKFSRMICLSDATGSMDGIWSATRDCITEMLRRIDEIGDGQFELMWVAYRDYSDGGGLLENSRWTKDPSELVEFVNGIRCYGGGDYPEAVEEALRLVNQETAIQQVTRALLIADAPPHPETKGQTLTDHSDRVMETDYMAEAKQLSENKVPVNTFRLNDEPSLLQSFNQIAEMTGGKSSLLDVSRNGSNTLMDIIAETALEDIGGKELVLEYRSRYSS